MIKDNMKAKAGLFTLLIGMISLVGFGITTADPVQNSIPDSMDCFDSEIVLVSVEMPFQMEFEIPYLEHQIDVQSNVIVFSNSSLEDANYSIYDYRSFEDPGLKVSKKYERTKNTITSVLIPPNEIVQRYHNLIGKNKSTLKLQVASLGSKFLLPDIS